MNELNIVEEIREQQNNSEELKKRNNDIKNRINEKLII